MVLYESFVRDTMARIERAGHDDQVTRRGLVLALLTGLKQICNHPAHFLKESGVVRLTGRSQKLDLVDELLGTVLAEDGAALVFTQYVAMGRLLEAHLAKAGIPHQFLHGGTPIREREAMVKRFQAGESPVFLLSLKAGGTGLNLTAADHVIHFDRWWNPAVEEQATDRAYRIGQTRPVQVHRLVTQGTIEERVALLLERKRALADAVLGGGEAALTELDDDELRDLVTLRREDARRDGQDRMAVTTVVHPRTPARRGAARATRWWAKAWVRAVEEASYSSADLTTARAISRSGRIGQISVEPGRFVAAVEDERGLWAVLGTVPVLDPRATRRAGGDGGRRGRPGGRPAGRRPAAHTGRARRGGRCRAAALRQRARFDLHLPGLDRPVPPRAGGDVPARLAGRGRPVRAAAPARPRP